MSAEGRRIDAGPVTLDSATGVAAGQPHIEWGAPDPSHRAQVAEIAVETGVFRPDEVDVALEVFDSFCEAPGTDYWALAAFTEGDRLAGFVFYGPTPCTVDTWDLYWIVVHPQLHGSGIGKGLVQRMEQHLASAGARLCLIETSARDDYATTRHFYEACGYEEVARIADFYDEGDDRVTYAKKLS